MKQVLVHLHTSHTVSRKNSLPKEVRELWSKNAKTISKKGVYKYRSTVKNIYVGMFAEKNELISTLRISPTTHKAKIPTKDLVTKANIDYFNLVYKPNDVVRVGEIELTCIINTRNISDSKIRPNVPSVVTDTSFGSIVLTGMHYQVLDSSKNILFKFILEHTPNLMKNRIQVRIKRVFSNSTKVKDIHSEIAFLTKIVKGTFKK